MPTWSLTTGRRNGRSASRRTSRSSRYHGLSFPGWLRLPDAPPSAELFRPEARPGDRRDGGFGRRVGLPDPGPRLPGGAEFHPPGRLPAGRPGRRAGRWPGPSSTSTAALRWQYVLHPDLPGPGQVQRGQDPGPGRPGQAPGPSRAVASRSRSTRSPGRSSGSPISVMTKRRHETTGPRPGSTSSPPTPSRMPSCCSPRAWRTRRAARPDLDGPPGALRLGTGPRAGRRLSWAAVDFGDRGLAGRTSGPTRGLPLRRRQRRLASAPPARPTPTVADAVRQEKLHGRGLRDTLAPTLARHVRFSLAVEQLPTPTTRVTIDRDTSTRSVTPARSSATESTTTRGPAWPPPPRSQQEVFRRAGIVDCTAPTEGPRFPSVSTARRPTHYHGMGHFAGTHAMGEPTRLARSWTRDQRSWDHRNLFLVGAGSMPTMGTSNPTLTLAALAIRTAEHLVES